MGFCGSINLKIIDLLFSESVRIVLHFSPALIIDFCDLIQKFEVNVACGNSGFKHIV